MPAEAGDDPTPELRELQDALRRAIADRRGYAHHEVDQRGWRVDLLRLVRDEFRARTLEAALAWCLVCLTAEEWGAK